MEKAALETTTGAAKPGAIQRWLKDHADRRRLEAVKTRLALLGPHLLSDIGFEDKTAKPVYRSYELAAASEVRIEMTMPEQYRTAAE